MSKTVMIPPVAVEPELLSKLLAKSQEMEVTRSVVLRWAVSAYLKAETVPDNGDSNSVRDSGASRTPTFLITPEQEQALKAKIETDSCTIAQAVRIGLKLL